jgi:hypothetical protein
MVDEARGEVERVDRRVADLTVAPTSPPNDVMAGLDARVAALTDMVETHRREVAAVMREVEQRMQDDVDRLIGLLEGQRRDLQSMLAVAADRAAPAPIDGEPDDDDLLEVLERQLLEAERRLADRSIEAGSE